MSDIAFQNTAATAPPQGFSKGIHGARGLFALAVVIYHVYNSGLPVWQFPPLLHHGLLSLKFGVEMFFAISGFVIIGTLARSTTAAEFLTNRATRIFPVLWAATLVFIPIALAGNLPRVAEHAAHPITFALITLGNLAALGPLIPIPVFLAVTWTICYEFAFYLLAACHLHARRATPFLLLAGALLILQHPRALFFVPGILVAIGLVQHRIPPILTKEPLIPLLLFLAAWHSAANPEIPRFEPIYLWSDPTRFALTGVAFAAATLAILGISEGLGWLSAALQSRAMLWLGTISYSLYLWHTIIIGVLKAAFWQLGIPAFTGEATQAIFLAIALPASLATAHLSAELLERRVTRALRKRVHA